MTVIVEAVPVDQLQEFERIVNDAWFPSIGSALVFFIEQVANGNLTLSPPQPAEIPLN